MSLSQLLAELNAKDIELKLGDSNELVLRAKKGALDAGLKTKITTEKLKLLLLLEQNGVQSTKARSIFSFGQKKYPLSSGQARMYFHEMLSPGTAVYNVPFIAKISQEIDENRLQLALEHLVAKHPSLRTRFILEDNMPQQIIAQKQRVTVNVIACNGSLDDASSYLEKEVKKSFDLAQAPLIRLTLIRSNEQSTIFVMMLHHIVTDAWSASLIIKDLNDFYLQPSTTVDSGPINMGDFALYENALMASKSWETQFKQRVETLRNFPAVLHMPFKEGRVDSVELRGKTVQFKFDMSIAEKLEAQAKRLGVSVASTLFALYGLLLRGLSKQDRIVVGIAAAQRDLDEVQDLVGFLVSSIPVPIAFDQVSSISAYIVSCHREVIEALDLKSIPFDRLVEQLGVKRELGVSPLVQSMFTYHEMPMNRTQLLGSTYEPLSVDIQQSKFTITAGFYNSGNGIEGAFEFDSSVFNQVQMQEVFKKYQLLVEGFAQDTYMTLGDVAATVSFEFEKTAKKTNPNGTPESLGNLQSKMTQTDIDGMRITISSIWLDLLGSTNIGDDDSFFEIGGNSLLAIQFISKMRTAGMPLTLKHVYKHQTISAICENL